MKHLAVAIGCAVPALLAALPLLAADPQAGKALFRQRCSVCHTAESGDNAALKVLRWWAYTVGPPRVRGNSHTVLLCAAPI